VRGNKAPPTSYRLAEEYQKKYKCKADHNLGTLKAHNVREFPSKTSGRKNVPQVCSHCNRKLIGGSDVPKDPKKYIDWKIKKGQEPMVRCCDHGRFEKYECVFALCPDCHPKLMEEESQYRRALGINSPRVKRRRRGFA
jgi:hypothetical protein